MREYGVNFSGSLTQFYQGLAVGSDSHNWKYGGKFDGFVRINGSKLGLWQGFGINAHAEVKYGEFHAFVGGTFLPNNLALLFKDLKAILPTFMTRVGSSAWGAVSNNLRRPPLFRLKIIHKHPQNVCLINIGIPYYHYTLWYCGFHSDQRRRPS
jgi:hypothetical protein